MRHLIALFLAFSFIIVPFGSGLWAQDDGTVYVVTDVAADVTADSAAHARDQAIAQAQRSAFNQLLDRLGANSSVATKLSDDDLSTLVKNFEVQNERTSSVRYIGTFTIQFKPNAVRTLLGSKNSGFTETRSPLVLILPVYNNNGVNILWEDKTKWRQIWESHAANEGLVPIVIPTGELDDIALLSTAESVAGKSTALKALSNKYQAAGGSVVAILSGNLYKQGSELKIDFIHYDADGAPLPAQHINLPALTDKASLDNALLQGVKGVRHQLEKDWQQNLKEAKTPPASDDEASASPPPPPQYLGQPPALTSSDTHEPTTHLPVVIPIASLAEWAQIKRTLDSIPYINQVDVITLQRGSSNIEIEFHGSLEALQIALSQQNLNLKQDHTNGVWMLQPAIRSAY